jgi:hypothetical protein
MPRGGYFGSGRGHGGGRFNGGRGGGRGGGGRSSRFRVEGRPSVVGSSFDLKSINLI